MNDDYCTMRSLGVYFGVSSHTIGRALKSLRVRTRDGQPTPRAKECGLVKLVEGPQPWVPLWLWHREMTVAILEGAGWKRADSPQVAGGDL
jgi:hypothetical protein